MSFGGKSQHFFGNDFFWGKNKLIFGARFTKFWASNNWGKSNDFLGKFIIFWGTN